MTLNFLADIYNGKISVKEAEFEQREIEKKKQKCYNLTMNQKIKTKRRNKWSINAGK